eukprot:m.70393 g.70393  ORF g.70393 m.70393 type:complete len:1202 (-) comp12127_c0_seq1:60-3665(-)
MMLLCVAIAQHFLFLSSHNDQPFSPNSWNEKAQVVLDDLVNLIEEPSLPLKGQHYIKGKQTLQEKFWAQKEVHRSTVLKTLNYGYSTVLSRSRRTGAPMRSLLSSRMRCEDVWTAADLLSPDNSAVLRFCQELVVDFQYEPQPDDVFQQALNVKDLTINGCLSLPPNLINNLDLTSLSVHGEIVSVSNTTLADQTDLESLSLVQNSITTLEVDTFMRTANLVVLDMRDNLLVSIGDTVLSPLTELEYLFLGLNFLTTISTPVFANLTKLVVVDLSYNRLSVLPSTLLQNSKNISWVYLAVNNLTQIQPKTFTDFRFLTRIDLEYNSLTVVPFEAFEFLADNITLRLDHNALTLTEPGAFDKLSLSKLELEYNTLNKIPSIFNMTELEYLHLQENNITLITDRDLSDLTGLKAIFLQNNAITAIQPLAFAQNEHLAAIYLDGNKLTICPEAVLSLPQLQILTLSHNSITTLQTSAFGNLTSLTALKLAHNLLSDFPPTVFLQASLQILDLSGNMLTVAPELDSVVSLDLSMNKITMVDAQLIRNTSALKSLSLANNMITTLDLDWLQLLYSLISIDVSSNELNSMSLGDLLGNLANDSSIRFISAAMNPFLPTDAAFLSSVCSNQESKCYEWAYVNFSNTNLVNELNSMSEQDRPLPYLRSLSLGENPELVVTESFWPSIVAVNSLDIAGINAVLPVGLCSMLRNLTMLWAGHSTLVDPKNLTEQSGVTLGVCMTRSSTLKYVDLSDSAIANYTWLQDAMQDVEWFGSYDSVPFLSMGSGNSVRCNLNAESQEQTLTLGAAAINYPSTGFGYRCQCADGYKEVGDGTCEKDVPWITEPANLALVISGAIVGGGGLTLLILWIVLRITRAEKSLWYHKRMLTDSNMEVAALKEAWLVEPDWVKLGDRIDKGSEGAFGEVYRAEFNGSLVAVKKLSALWGYDALSQESVRTEAEFLMKARTNINIVRFLGMGEWTDGAPFIVMELVMNGNLAKYLSQHKHIAMVQKVTFATDIARAMHYIHARGQMHRDLKTANCLVTKDLRIKVADFGTIKRVFKDFPKKKEKRKIQKKDSPLLSNGIQNSYGTDPQDTMPFAGTVLYTAPEIFHAEKFTYSADVWSYGIILWEVCAQRIPDLQKECDPNGKWQPFLVCYSQHLDDGQRLPCDNSWPQLFLELIRFCWVVPAYSRVSFKEILDRLETALQDST